MSRPIHRLVVLSDAHLGAVPDPVEAALLGLLDQVPALGDGLLINGDLFGFWFAYRRAIPRAGLRVVARVAELARRIPVLMTGGNHDRWGDSIWPELGVRFSAGELRFRLGDLPALALHGDQVPAVSRRTRLKSAMFRSRLASAVYRALPAELGFRLTAPLAAPSRSPAAQREEDATARRQRAWAEAFFRNGADLALLIMGHSHRAIGAELAPGHRYLNPGAWFDGYRYAVATADCLELSQFPAR
jgi:UDP-2,3-diacylglucosamine hydrolase